MCVFLALSPAPRYSSSSLRYVTVVSGVTIFFFSILLSRPAPAAAHEPVAQATT